MTDTLPARTTLARASAVSRRLPASRWKNRVGRVVGAGLTRLGAQPLVLVDNPDGSFLVDARSRTESEMLWSGAYDDDDIAFLRAATPEDGVFLDVGANVGLIFVPVWRAITTGHAIAVEPIPVNFDRLARTCAANRSTGSEPTLLNVALGREAGTLVLVKEGDEASSDNAVAAVAGESGVAVPMATLDETAATLALTRLDTVKLDVEGYEWEVLDGGRATLERLRPLVYGEFNNQLMPRRGKTFHDVWDIFEPLGYRCFSFLDRLALDEKPDPPAELGNVVLVPGERADWLRGRGVTIREATR